MKESATTQYNYVDPFNFIRSIAVICVFLLHTSLFSGQLGFVYDRYTWPLKTPAWSAVWILFVLSGYFIGKGFFKGRYAFNAKGFLKFYLKRFIKVGGGQLGYLFLFAAQLLNRNLFLIIRKFCLEYFRLHIIIFRHQME